MDHNDRSIDVSVSAEGKILEIKEEVPIAELPAAVAKAINSEYPNAKSEEAEQVTEFEDEEHKSDDDGSDQDDKGEAGDEDEEASIYEVEIKTPEGESLEVEVTAEGKMLEAESDEDSAEESED